MVNQIYHVTIHGRTFESRNLRQLLALAVTEKRNMDRQFRFYAPVISARSDAAPGNGFAETALAAQF